MPFVRIDVVEGKPQSFRAAVGKLVHEAIVETLNVPADDHFQVLGEHPAADMIADPQYLGIERSGDQVFVQVTLNAGRSSEIKQSFYAAVAQKLRDELGIRPEDVLINLVDVAKIDWSFGNGEAQYA